VSELRQHRATLAGLIGKLKLPDEGAAETASSAGRAMANQRWSKRPA
jgi:hypothetical protein